MNECFRGTGRLFISYITNEEGAQAKAIETIEGQVKS